QELTLRAIESLALFTDPLTRQRIQRLNAALA
ncbi:MAG: hypothetical protein JWP74_63, partial [Marmoricola sp.]|nr:hypothetical protein [Marmoricola sp.]